MPRARRLVPALALLAVTVSAVPVRAVPGERPVVVVAEFDGIIHPIAAEYLGGVIDDADTSNATLVVFVLRTPGGLLDSTRTIISRMIASPAASAIPSSSAWETPRETLRGFSTEIR